MGKLNVRRTKELSRPGRYGDGGGLYLHIRRGGSRQWVLRTTIHKRRKDIGLGSLTYFTLAEAREEAHRLQREIKRGFDPLAERARLQGIPQFSTAAQTVWEQNRPTWKNKKHAQQWIKSLQDFAYPKIGSMKVCDVRSAHILRILTPIWTSKPETARRVRQRLRAVFDWAKASGYYDGENPVSGIKMALPKQMAKPKHHAALPWQDLPVFMDKLVDQTSISSQALVFLILTAGRSGEIRGAQWSEMSEDAWCIPAERMKIPKDHRVPLTAQARKCLSNMKGHSETLVFPSIKNSQVEMSNMVFKALFKRMGYDEITAHGFRSTFRDWVADNAIAAREVAEAALAHRVGNETERAYARSDIFERRRVLMQAWSDYALGSVA